MAKLPEEWTSKVVHLHFADLHSHTSYYTLMHKVGASRDFAPCMTLLCFVCSCASDISLQTNNPPVSLTNGLLSPEVIKPEDVVFK